MSAGGRARRRGGSRAETAARVCAALALAAALAAPPARAAAGGSPGPSEADRVRLAEAFRLAAACSETVWPGWSSAPFAILLVTEEREFLVRSGERPAGFEKIGDDPRLGSILARGRQFPPNLLATFPAFGSTPTIVVGTAEATGTGSTQWVVKVLHEHFHQLQMSAPGYYEESHALGLSDGDDQARWMLDYPFPYESEGVREAYGEAVRQLARTLAAAGGGGPGDSADFWARFRRLEAALSEKDFRYLSFQLWQEGIARYVELRVAECAAAEYEPSAPFRALADFESFGSFARRLRAAILEALRAPALAEEKRVAFYDLGAGIGLLLDRGGGAAWKARYLAEKFDLRAVE